MTGDKKLWKLYIYFFQYLWWLTLPDPGPSQNCHCRGCEEDLPAIGT